METRPSRPRIRGRDQRPIEFMSLEDRILFLSSKDSALVGQLVVVHCQHVHFACEGVFVSPSDVPSYVWDALYALPC